MLYLKLDKNSLEIYFGKSWAHYPNPATLAPRLLWLPINHVTIRLTLPRRLISAMNRRTLWQNRPIYIDQVRLSPLNTLTRVYFHLYKSGSPPSVTKDLGKSTSQPRSHD
jgi:hypothetical protein